MDLPRNSKKVDNAQTECITSQESLCNQTSTKIDANHKTQSRHIVYPVVCSSRSQLNRGSKQSSYGVDRRDSQTTRVMVSITPDEWDLLETYQSWNNDHVVEAITLQNNIVTKVPDYSEEVTLD